MTATRRCVLLPNRIDQTKLTASQAGGTEADQRTPRTLVREYGRSNEEEHRPRRLG
jgi:hypothetical protein